MTKKTLAKTWLTLIGLIFLSLCVYLDAKLTVIIAAVIVGALATMWSLCTLDETIGGGW